MKKNQQNGIPYKEDFREWLKKTESDGGWGLTDDSANSYLSNLAYLDSCYLRVFGMSLARYAESIKQADIADDIVSEEELIELLELIASAKFINRAERKRLKDALSALRAYIVFIRSIQVIKTQELVFNKKQLIAIFKNRLKTQDRIYTPVRSISATMDIQQGFRYNDIILQAILNIIILTEEGAIRLDQIEQLEIKSTGEVFVLVSSVQRNLRVLTYTYNNRTFTGIKNMNVSKISSISLDHTPSVSEIVRANKGLFKILGSQTKINSRNINKALKELECLYNLSTLTLTHLSENQKKGSGIKP